MLTEGFFSKHCSSQPAVDLRKVQSQSKTRIHIEVCTRKPAGDRSALLRMWIRQQQRNRWKILQRLSGDSAEMKQRIVLLLIVSLRERVSSFFKISFLDFSWVPPCVCCVFSKWCPAKQKNSWRYLLWAAGVITHFKSKTNVVIFFPSLSICHALYLCFNVMLIFTNIPFISHDLMSFNNPCHLVTRQNIISAMWHSYVWQ